MKDAKIAKQMKKLAKAAHEALIDVPTGVMLEEWEAQDVNDWLNLLASAKFMFKWHTTRDRWAEVDEYEATVVMLHEGDRYDV